MSKTEERVSRLPDADMQAVPRALTRVAQRARELAERTGTQLVVNDEATSEASDDQNLLATRNE